MSEIVDEGARKKEEADGKGRRTEKGQGGRGTPGRPEGAPGRPQGGPMETPGRPHEAPGAPTRSQDVPEDEIQGTS